MTSERAEPKVEHAELRSIMPCPENDGVYGKQSLVDPDIMDLIEFNPRQRCPGAAHHQRR